jgi:hypothetical protein
VQGAYGGSVVIYGIQLAHAAAALLVSSITQQQHKGLAEKSMQTGRPAASAAPLWQQ